MPKSLSAFLKIAPSDLEDKGAFDPILDLDTRLFIDPHLLKHTEVEEFKDSYEKMQQHFLKIGKLIAASDSIGDPFWKSADRLMQWSEVKGLCIGYSSKGTSGSGIGAELRERLLITAKKIIEKGKSDPEIFELVGMFEDDFGPDRISDMTANVIKDELGVFTRRILGELDVDLSLFLKFDDALQLPINPYTNEVLYLVPRDLLRDLPVALDWSNYDIIASHNAALREHLNSIIGHSWREATRSMSKSKLKDLIFQYPELIDELVNTYSAKEAQPYDFASDRAGEYMWYPTSRKLASEHPLNLALSTHPTIDEVEELVIAICERFRELIENNGLSGLLYESNGKAKHEKAAQLLFYGIADAYCDSNNIMIARESDAGRGPVDFKFGTNRENSILVEIKKSTNTSGLKKGVIRQLPEYMKSEKSKRAIYLVLDVGYTKAAIKRLKEINTLVNGAAIKILHIDALQKESASKI